MSRWTQTMRSMVTLVAAMALALQLVLPMPQPAGAATHAAVQTSDCHAQPAASHHGGKHGAPSGNSACDWCMLCGKLGTAVGPLDRVVGLPERAEAPMAVQAAAIELGHDVVRPRTGPVGARAPPGIA